MTIADHDFFSIYYTNGLPFLGMEDGTVLINSQANQHNGAVAKESSSREHHEDRKSSDVSRSSSFKGNRKLGCLGERWGDLFKP